MNIIFKNKSNIKKFHAFVPYIYCKNTDKREVYAVQCWDNKQLKFEKIRFQYVDEDSLRLKFNCYRSFSEEELDGNDWGILFYCPIRKLIVSLD
ncbi:hypothetical protein [Campylobacter helveticus]|uniref:Uncharacterized protein n=1 Tax=Campylobacter helveticus TaxID=28898 RepID=A0AAX2UIS2_9BACT|nr:hypothetical protein [Campylobacter helveticus]ARE81484.1 hypothetical protein CHELV3228_b0020 [Campylobacter helveticus]MCR2055614.1 hypothetical protein [Campylobacter helveticus]TNB57482.1 hypothetical protein FDW42_04910 [Campylobacter helveticus]TNH32455.1 hypothetical protein FDW48_07115 [Campylobacter helveticus]TXK50309.1 hypothetical protein A9726_08610 [Campylobacter helveticus]